MRGEEIARELEALLDAAADAEARLDAVARLLVPHLGVACCIHLLDENGHLVPAGLAHADPAREDALRTHAADERGELHPLLWRGLRAEEALVIESPAATIVPLRAARGQLGTLALLHDEARRSSDGELDLVRRIAGRLAVAIDYARAVREADTAGRAKADFLALMSHELKTPLNIILGYADLLQRGVPDALPEAALRQVERLKGGAMHLLTLIDEVLTLARLQAGEERVRVRDIAVADVIAETTGIAAELAAGRRLAIHTTADEDVTIRTDPVKLRQILLELLTNAVKFTPEGEIDVALETTADGVAISVRDTGTGMAPAELQQAFEAFWQGDRSLTRRAGGSGLGLAVAARLARLLGGSLTLSSEPDKGTTARLELPWHGKAETS